MVEGFRLMVPDFKKMVFNDGDTRLPDLESVLPFRGTSSSTFD